MIKDSEIMPFGKHKGEKLANVPADYLLYMHNNCAIFGKVKQYVDENYDLLTKEKADDEAFNSKSK